MENSYYNVVSNVCISQDEISSLTLLYQPLFTFPALSLYLTLYENSKLNMEIETRYLLHALQIDVVELESQRCELEKFGLIKTYQLGSLITVFIQEPLKPSHFLSHPTYGRLFAIVQGNQRFSDLANRYSPKQPDSDAFEISKSFDLSRLSTWDETSEESFTSYTKNRTAKSDFDVDRFFRGLPLILFPKSLRTQEVYEKVESFGSFYKLSNSDMKSVLLQSTNFDSETFDSKKFQYFIEKNHQIKSVDSVSNPYDLDPVSFLAYKQEHSYVVDADKKLLSDLTKNFGFNNQVVNALIEYILQSNDQNLNRSYTEKIASVWKRRNVSDLDDVKEVIKSQHTNSKTVKPRVEVVKPTYSKDETIDENVDELKDRLKTLIRKENT